MKRKEFIKDAPEGIYKDLNSNEWYDSQQIRDIKTGEKYFGFCVYDTFRNQYKRNVISVWPIKKTISNKLMWKFWNFLVDLDESGKVEKFLEKKSMRVIGATFDAIVDWADEIKAIIREKDVKR